MTGWIGLLLLLSPLIIVIVWVIKEVGFKVALGIIAAVASMVLIMLCGGYLMSSGQLNKGENMQTTAGTKQDKAAQAKNLYVAMILRRMADDLDNNKIVTVKCSTERNVVKLPLDQAVEVIVVEDEEPAKMLQFKPGEEVTFKLIYTTVEEKETVESEKAE